MPNGNAKGDVDISVTDELDAAERSGNQRRPSRALCQPGRILRLSPARCIRPRFADRRVIGGLHGRSEFGLVYVAWFFLPEDRRRARIGSRVLAVAEEEGRRRGCTRIALTTLSIEAPGFYLKQG
jgi:GNAT superfamily N-acetyltransferase